MTLALYGKTRKRQGTLLLAALLSILAATVGGLALIGTAFAHHSEHKIVVNCTAGTYSYDADFFGGGTGGTPRRAKVYKNNVLVHTQDFTGTTNVANYYTDSGTLPVAGTVTYRIEMFSGSPGFSTNQDGEEPDDVSISGDGGCAGAKIVVKKVQVGGPAGTPFFASIDNKSPGNEGSGSNLQFNPTKLERTITFDEGDESDNFDVTEAAVGNFTATGWKVLIGSSEAACPSSSAPFGDGSGSWAIGSYNERTVDDFTLDDGEVATVCFRNEYVDGRYQTCTDAGLHMIDKLHQGTPWGFDGTEGDPTGLQVTANGLATGDVTWTSTIPISLVIVKGGSGPVAYKNYTYNPASSGSEVVNGDGLVNSGGNEPAISHIEFCGNPPSSSTSVSKTHAGDGTYNLNESFSYTLTFQVSGAATTSAQSWNDDLPAHLDFVSLGAEVDAGNKLSCSGDTTGDHVTCTLDSGAAIGTYSRVINVQVKSTAACTPAINQVKTGLTPGAGDNAGQADTVNISGCGSVGVTKSDGVQVGGNVQWTITLTNTSVVAANVYVYDASTSLVSETCDGSVSESPADWYNCTIPGKVGDVNGTATLVLATAIPAYNVCQGLEMQNTAYVASSNTAGTPPSQPIASDGGVFNIAAAPCITFTKSDGVAVGDEIHWTITVNNTGGSAGSIDIYDANTSLESENCTNADVADNPVADTYRCGVAASSSASFVLSTPLPANPGSCDNILVNNTASVIGGSSDTAQYSDTAEPTVSCFDISKEQSDTVQGQLDWVISVASTADVAMSVFVQDAGAAFHSVLQGGSCGVAQGTDMTAGIVCTVNANSTLKIVVTKATPTATCEGTPLGNTVTVRLGTHAEAPIIESNVDGGTYQAAGANPELCDREITITKLFLNTGPYTPVAGDIPAFTLNPSEDTICGAPVLAADGLSATVTCTVPYDWAGTVTETPKPGWTEMECPVVEIDLKQELLSLVAGLVLQEQALPSSFVFCNEPSGTITVIKQDNVSADNPDRPADWDFTVTGPSAFSQSDSIALGGGQFVLQNVPLGNGYGAAEDNGSFGQCPLDSNPNGDGYETTEVTPGTQNLATPGGNITFIFRNDDCGVVAGTGTLRIVKVQDINGDHVFNGADTYLNWTVTVTGPEFPGGQQFNVPNNAAGLVLAGLTEGDYTIVEDTSALYAVVGVVADDNGPVFNASTSATVALANNDEDVVTFYNQPLREIRVVKTAVTRHNANGPDIAAPNDDDGWLITVSSVQCQVNQTVATDANGLAVFTNLPVCNDYVVSENPVNPNSPNFNPGGPVQFNNQTPGLPGNPLVLTFLNRKQTFDPPCANCNSVTPTPTPVTPTATPTTPTTTATPTNTPVPPTNTPTNTPTTPSPSVTNIAGERTPGPGQTPIAPSTGDGGLMGGAGGGMNLALIIGGLLALTSGLGFVAVGRKRSSR